MLHELLIWAPASSKLGRACNRDKVSEANQQPGVQRDFGAVCLNGLLCRKCSFKLACCLSKRNQCSSSCS
eukprot:3948019-Amphidinium_carterae.1